MKRFGQITCVGSIAVLLAACLQTTYVDKASLSDDAASSNPAGRVVYQVHQTYKDVSPTCIAILPFDVPSGAQSEAKLRIDQSQTVRRAMYAHLAPQGKRDIELARIDYVLSQSPELKSSLVALGTQLNCDAILKGSVIEYGSQFIGVYSRVAVGADLQLVRAVDGAVLWEGKHIAESHGGSLPLSPVGLAMGVLDAANNVSEEQVLRVIDDLARRLVSTIPDDRIAVLDDPLQPIPSGAVVQNDKRNPEGLIAALKGKPAGEQRALLLSAIDQGTYGQDGTKILYQELVGRFPTDTDAKLNYGSFLMDGGAYEDALLQAQAARELQPTSSEPWFLQSRALLKLERIEAADDSIVHAIARQDDNPLYYNTLGYVSTLREQPERAIAAYQMAIKHDSTNGFAYYNMGVGFYNVGDYPNAADSFYGAGLSYLKTGHYGQVEKVLSDLADLKAAGIDVSSETQTLRRAMAAQLGQTEVGD